MMKQSDGYTSTARLTALAQRFEAEGHVNLSKLLDAAVYSRLHRGAWRYRPPVTVATMQAELAAAIDDLKEDDLASELIEILEAGRQMIVEGRGEVLLIKDAPDVYVCRTCGHLALGSAPDHCPECGAWPGGFRKFVGIFNGDNTDLISPMEVLALMARNADALASLVAGLSQEQMNTKPAPDVWAIHNHVSHFRDAQDTLDTRVNLMLTEDKPELVSVALYEMATGARPASTSELLADFLDKRQSFIARMEALPLKDFWRKGWHSEFGDITVVRQMAYMAYHEQTHLPDIEALRRQVT